MSTIMKTQTNLELKYKIEKYKYRFWSFLTFLFIFFIIPSKGISLFPLLICLLFEAKHSKQVNIFRSGIHGEQLALQLLKQLPKEYTILTDVNITIKDQHNQIDYVILGPNGIFVVEVKHHNGKIVGHGTNKMWNQIKKGKHGVLFTNSLNNPIKQVNRQVYYLSQYFKHNNIYTWIQGIVFFSNQEAQGNIITQNKVPVFMMNVKKGKDLLKYILKNKNSRLNSFQKRKIINLLHKNK